MNVRPLARTLGGLAILGVLAWLFLKPAPEKEHARPTTALLKAAEAVTNPERLHHKAIPTSSPTPPSGIAWSAPAQANAAGTLHRAKRHQEADPLGRDFAALIAAAEHGDLDAAVRAAILLNRCLSDFQMALEDNSEAIIAKAGPQRELMQTFFDGRKNRNLDVLLYPLIPEIEAEGFGSTQVGFFRECKGATFVDLKRAHVLLQNAAAQGSSDAAYELGANWARYAGLRVGVMNPFGLIGRDDAQALAARYPEAAAMREQSRSYLLAAAHAGNFEALQELQYASWELGGNPQQNREQNYFWKLVRVLAAPDLVAEQQTGYAERTRIYNADPANANRRIPEPPPFDAIKEIDPDSNYIDPSRAAAIRTAAEAMVRRCCQRKSSPQQAIPNVS